MKWAFRFLLTDLFNFLCFSEYIIILFYFFVILALYFIHLLSCRLSTEDLKLMIFQSKKQCLRTSAFYHQLTLCNRKLVSFQQLSISMKLNICYFYPVSTQPAFVCTRFIQPNLSINSRPTLYWLQCTCPQLFTTFI